MKVAEFSGGYEERLIITGTGMMSGSDLAA